MIRRGWIAVLLALLGLARAPAAAQPADAAARFNGTWKVRIGGEEDGGHEANGEFKLWALDEHRLRVEFYGNFIYKTGIGRVVNNGSASAVAIVRQGKAFFRADEEGECRFSMRVRRTTDLVVRQSGYNNCFGFNVTATGRYRRTSTARPTFIDDPPAPGAPD
ncbi:MAG TPA: hypothetical protein VFQ45_07450 [Longimicrobium sp.]|nr:hypothetical protein [Longimicrobium sp.]